jgi:hypothetical protein
MVLEQLGDMWWCCQMILELPVHRQVAMLQDDPWVARPLTVVLQDTLVPLVLELFINMWSC